MANGSDVHSERRQFFGAAKRIAGITLCSRVAGMVRDITLSRTFGVSGMTDAFYFAFMIPNLFRRLFGEGALSAAFVPVFSEAIEREGRRSAGTLLANVAALLGLGLCVVCVLVEVGLLIAHVSAPAAWAGRSVLSYAGIMMPFMVTICLLALGSAALNCVKHFAYPAAAPIILNVCIIAAAVCAVRFWEPNGQRPAVVAVGVTVAGVIQLAGVMWLLRAHGLPCVPRLRPIHPGVRKMLTMMGPMMIGLGALQLNTLVNKLIAWCFSGPPGQQTIDLFGRTFDKPLTEGVVTWLYYGERLYQFPLGVLALALATAVFPLFSRHAARGDLKNLRRSVNRALRLAVFEGLPSGVGLILLAEPLTALLFASRGSLFTAEDARQTAHVVRFFGLGMWAFCAQQILLRAFYAQKDTATPLKVACGMIGLNVLLNLSLIWVPAVRHGAFGLATSTASSVSVLVLVWILRRRLKRIGGRALAVSLLRVALATAAMGVAVWQVKTWLPRWGMGGNLYIVGAGVIVGVAAYLLACKALGAPEVGELLARKQADGDGGEG